MTPQYRLMLNATSFKVGLVILTTLLLVYTKIGAGEWSAVVVALASVRTVSSISRRIWPDKDSS